MISVTQPDTIERLVIPADPPVGFRHSGRGPVLAALSAAGLLLVALADWGGRSNVAHAAWLYWLGEAVIIAAPAYVLVGRRTVTAVETGWIAVILPVTGYLVNQCYAPDAFKFPDELQHLPTLQAILSTHHLFHTNFALPISARYPGLEIVTSALVQTTHLSVTTAGVIVSGLVHTLACIALYVVALKVSRRPRVAGLAVLIYAMSPHYQSLDAEFVYGAMALPFVILGMLALLRTFEPGRSPRWRWAGVVVVLGATTVVCHHVSALIFVAILAAGVATYCVLGLRPRRWAALSLLGAVAAVVGFWMTVVAPGTWSYLNPDLQRLLGTTSTKVVAVTAATPGTFGSLVLGSGHNLQPAADSIAGYIGTLILVALVGCGLLRVVLTARGKDPRWMWMSISSLSLLALLGVRLVAPGGSELAGRAFEYVLIPGSIVAALGVQTLVAVHRSRRMTLAVLENRRTGPSRNRVVFLAGLLVVAAVGQLAIGWPPAYERLPGPYAPGTWERSVDQREVGLSQWALQTLGPGHRFAASAAASGLLGGIGLQDGVQGISEVYLWAKLNPSEDAFLRRLKIQYVVVDPRMATTLPLGGSYFTFDPFPDAYGAPLPAADLDKFAQLPGVSRVYDDGVLVVYDVSKTAIG